MLLTIEVHLASAFSPTETLTNSQTFSNRIQILFSGIIGIFIGAGYLVQTCMLCIILFAIYNNSTSIIKNINYKKNDDIDTDIMK